MRAFRRSFTVLAAAATGVVLAACGSSSGSTATSSTSSGGTGSASTSLATAYAGVTGALPTAAVKVTKGESVWVVSCGQSVATCSGTAAAAIDAAKKIGWNTRLCDGALNPASISSCIRQAVAAKAKAVDIIGSDCPPIKQALTEANAAGVKTVGGGGFDCSELGGSAVFSGYVRYLSAYSNHDWWALLGKLQADWVIGKTNGTAKVLSLKFTDEAWGTDIQNAFVKELATCSGCSVVKTLEIGNADVATGTLRTKFSTALLQSATANAVNAPIDGWFAAGLEQAVTSSGRSSKLAVIGGIGQVPNMGYIRSGGGQDASASFSSVQSGWAGIDVAARLLAGETEPAGGFPEGVGLQVVDATHNLPPAGEPYQPTVDFMTGYAKLWGVG